MEISTAGEQERDSWIPMRENFSGNSGAVPEFNPGEMHRKALVARQFRRMAISSHQPVPGQERMLLMVEDACRLWKEIPESELSSIVDEAMIRAGGFMATAGLVAQCWREKCGAVPDLGRGTRLNESETREYLAWLHKADQEKAPPEFVAEFCRTVIARLEGRACAA